MHTINTKYIGPSNTKGSRIRATSTMGVSISVDYDSGLGSVGNHVAAAKALCDKFVTNCQKATGKNYVPAFLENCTWISGDAIGGGMVHVQIEDTKWTYQGK